MIKIICKWFFSVSSGIESEVRSVDKLTKYLSIPRSIRYNLFSKIQFNSRRINKEKWQCKVVVGK